MPHESLLRPSLAVSRPRSCRDDATSRDSDRVQAVRVRVRRRACRVAYRIRDAQCVRCEPRCERRERALALFPDARSAARIERIAHRVCGMQRGMHVGARAPVPLGPDRYHVTLHHLGNYAGGLPQAMVARAIRAASTVSVKAFAVAFDRAEDFRGRPLVLRAHEGALALMAFRFELGKALESAGFAGRTRVPFTPHVTL